jgi:hypothetical protein
MPFQCSRRCHIKRQDVKGVRKLDKKKKLVIEGLIGFVIGAVVVSVVYFLR